MDKPYYKYSIPDMDVLLKEHFFFEGYVRRKASPEYEKYMEKPEFAEKCKTSLRTILCLLGRMIRRPEDESTDF